MKDLKDLTLGLYNFVRGFEGAYIQNLLVLKTLIKHYDIINLSFSQFKATRLGGGGLLPD